MPVAVPGLATALALIITYGELRGFRTSWAFILVGHVLFTLPFMVRSVLAVMIGDRPEDAGRRRGEPRRQLSRSASFSVVLPNCRARHPRRRADGGDAVDGRVQHDLDAAHAAHQDAAGGPRRQLCLDAAGDRQRLHDRVLPDDRAAADRACSCLSATERRDKPAEASSEQFSAAAAIAIRLERCAKTFRGRHARARAARPRRSPPARPWCFSARRAAARRRRCASSPGSRRPMPAGACCSATTT